MIGVKNAHVRVSVPNARLFDECCAYLSLIDCKAKTTAQNGKYWIVAYHLTNHEAIVLLKTARGLKSRSNSWRKQKAQCKRKMRAEKHTTMPVAA